MMDLYYSMVVVTDWDLYLLYSSVFMIQQAMFIFILFIFIKFDCNFINNLMLFYLYRSDTAHAFSILEALHLGSLVDSSSIEAQVLIQCTTIFVHI
jgi:hypothetical protein